jgi:hypothetical protein
MEKMALTAANELRGGLDTVPFPNSDRVLSKPKQ